MSPREEEELEATEEIVEEDDSVIGRAFGWSLLVIAAVAVVAAVAWFIGSRPEEQQAEQKIEVAAPQAVQRRVEAPQVRFVDITAEAGIDFVHVSGAYGDKLLMESLDFDLPRGGIVGVIGPNGAGKSTLFRMIVGQETPDDGSISVGETVDLCFAEDPFAAVAAGVSDVDLVAIGLRNIQSNDYSGVGDNIAYYERLMAAIRGATEAPVVLGGAASASCPRVRSCAPRNSAWSRATGRSTKRTRGTRFAHSSPRACSRARDR